MDPENIGSYGLKFLMENQKDLVLNENVVEGIISSVVSIARRKKAEYEAMPDDAESPDFEEKREEVQNRNNEIEKSNQEIEKLQSKISIAYTQGTDANEDIKEECLI